MPSKMSCLKAIFRNAVSALWMCGMFVPLSARAGDDFTSTLRTEGVAGWKELERLQSQSSYELRMQKADERALQKPLLKTSDQSFAYNAGDFLIKTSDNKVWGGNAKYVFCVGRDDAASPWAVQSLGSSGADGYEDNGDRIFGPFLRTPWSIFGVPLNAVVTDPSFHLVKSSKPAGQSSESASIDVFFKIDSTQTTIADIQRLSSGRFTCNSGNNWALESYELQLKPNAGTPGGTIVSATVKYGPRSQDYLDLQQISYALAWENAKGKSRVSWQADITSSRHCDLPPEAFTLSAYSLPEPAALVGVRNRVWLWIDMIGIVLLLLAISLRWYFRPAA